MGSSLEFYVQAHINGSRLGTLTNLANVTGKSPTGLSYSFEDTADVLARKAAVQINKTAIPKEAVLMQNVTFTINVTNTGNITLNPVKVVDLLPMGLSYASDNRGGVHASGTVTWANVGPLAPGASTYIIMDTYVDGSAAGVLEDFVNVTAKPTYGSNVTAQDNESITAYLKADFVVTKTALNESVEPGENAVFIINVTNTGDVSLPTVKVVDVLPLGLTYVSDNSTPPGVQVGQVITWNNVGPLAAGASKFIELVAKVVL